MKKGHYLERKEQVTASISWRYLCMNIKDGLHYFLKKNERFEFSYIFTLESFCNESDAQRFQSFQLVSFFRDCIFLS